jgi:hypothetical protein
VRKLTKEESTGAAITSHKKYSKETDTLRSLPDGVVDLDISEIHAFHFSEEEELHLLQLYIDNPLPKQTGEQTTRLMQGVETLSKTVTSGDAERFKSWNDKFQFQKISLHQCFDEHAKFLIDIEIKRDKTRLRLSNNDVKLRFRKC